MRHTTPAPARLARSLLACAAVLALGPPVCAWALDSGELAVEVLVDGRPSREYHARGTTYVEARQGAEYSLRLTNRSGIRVAVALAVDGLNSIDARTTSAAAAAKWVLDPWETVTIDGWQMSQQAARRFVFTTEPDSYGAWLGRADNLGVIEAVAFRERPAPREYADQAERPQAKEQAGRQRSGAAPSPGMASEAAAGALSQDHAATGTGRRVDNPVRRVDLELEPQPSARVRLRYEYRPQLVALGVLPAVPPADPLDRRERSRGFSDSDFCPDPSDW
ncbi:MAG TPA: hypothetical protein PKJ99_11230 [Thermoanaerobaculales bacterium]|nr:hypothetical protein [Thermoanaerobaculales bacterium]HQL29293.1 hypothetical protein [Thermoanaerobaculales bacterium]HQN97198.1 hypothetical protein [Thermoanaerobaculales bacterium]HQP44755.1 hypothetical protein [Thermoanaerobaculales bacterium]